ncbi:uncharacterized protein LOC134788951, partial [Penaeus indicus]|uniref:uncharacterized protein LOC134788951 n=1 Tax=Penaeus indicus TaxID=29960 RepID=UPI00300CC041
MALEDAHVALSDVDLNQDKNRDRTALAVSSGPVGATPRPFLHHSVALAFPALVVGACWGHGRLVEPPSRASAWRFGFDVPVDYNDDESFCGGVEHQYQNQSGRCGICGDAWDENPRPHEAGGKYATGTIVRTYTEGQTITVRVNVTSNHGGHFEFRICPNNDPSVEASDTCLD